MVVRAVGAGRRGLGLALAALLAAACSSGDDSGRSRDHAGGAGGDGGNAGAGGTGGDGAGGGTGGDGGAAPPCELACPPGETCVLGEPGLPPRCACTEGSCPEGQHCNEGHWCEDDGPVGDFAPCYLPETAAERTDGVRFFCSNLFNPSGGYRWLRFCGATEDCPLAHMICLGELLGYDVAPYCMVNRCGENSLGPELEPPLPGNGDGYGVCSATSAYLGEDTVADGTCIPLPLRDGTLYGVCAKTGTVPKTRPCHPDAGPADSAFLCGADATCLFLRADWPRRECAHDAECAGIPRTFQGLTEWVDGYCARDRTCWTWGACADLCNAGYAGAGIHENAGCTDPVAVCEVLSGIESLRVEYPVVEGFCEARCRMFDPDACPEFLPGVPRACYPSFDEADPLRGTCIDQLETAAMIGDPCEPLADATECPDGSACLSLGTGDAPRCLQWCACAAGFDGSTSVCRDASANVGCGTAGDACVVAVPGSPVGVCATRG